MSVEIVLLIFSLEESKFSVYMYVSIEFPAKLENRVPAWRHLKKLLSNIPSREKRLPNKSTIGKKQF